MLIFRGGSSWLSLVIVAVVSFFCVSCSENPDVVRYRTEKAPVEETEAIEGAERSSPSTGEISWQAPATWGKGRASSMRLASFAIPLEDGESADVSLTRLSGMAGGLLANVNRWRGQIGLSPVAADQLDVEERESGKGRKYVYLELENENSGQAIYGAIYEADGFALFAKMTVGLAAARAKGAEFKEFCDSVSLGE